MNPHNQQPKTLRWLKPPLLAALLVVSPVSLSGASPQPGSAPLNHSLAQQPTSNTSDVTTASNKWIDEWDIIPPTEVTPNTPDITIAPSFIDQGFNLLQLSKRPGYELQTTKGSLQTALESFDIALRLLQKVDDQRLKVRALMGKAQTLVVLGDVESNSLEKALKQYNEALSILREKIVRQAFPKESRREEAETFKKIAQIHTGQGQWQKAIQYLNQFLSLFQANGDRSSEATILKNLGEVYDDLGDKQEARKYYNQALVLWREKELRAAFPQESRIGEAAILSNIAILEANQSNWQQSLESLIALLRMTKDWSSEKADILTKIGLVYAKQKKWQQALKYYEDALGELRMSHPLLSIPTVFKIEGKNGIEGVTTGNIIYPGIFVGEGDGRNQKLFQQMAILYNYIGQARAILNPRTSPAYFLVDKYYADALKLSQATGDKSVEARIHGNLAELYRGQGKLPEALTQINAAIELIEGLRSELRDDSLKASYFASVQDYYQFKVDLLMQLHPQQPQQRYDIQALETADQGRARVLRDLLTEARAKITKDIAPQLRQREEDLQFQLARAEKELIRFSSSQEAQAHVQVARIQAQINALLREQDRLKAEIRRESPAYAKLQYPQPMTLAQIQQHLDDQTLLLYYALGDDRSYLWAVSKTSLTSYTLPGRKAIEQAANQFKDVLNAPGTKHLSVTSPAFQSNTVAAATQLSDLILKPVAAQLGNHRLVIVADGALHYVPFAALSLSGQPYTPLVTQHDLVNLPSASTIAILRDTVLKNRQPAPKTVAVLADPVFNKDDALTRKPVQQASQPTRSAIASSQENALTIQLNQSFMQQLTRSLQRNGWPRLERTATEARAILALVPKAEDKLAAFDFDANYTWITNPQLKQYRHLLLATHGIFEPNNPANSGLLLSQFDSQGNPVERGYLRLGDLFNLNLGAELVVLSACQTGLGENLRGEGIVGLTRGLMYAGAPRVVTSLWNVDDQGTAELMQQFYQAILNEGQPPAAALNAAQRSMWQKGKNPYLWAAFTLQGEWR